MLGDWSHADFLVFRAVEIISAHGNLQLWLKDAEEFLEKEYPKTVPIPDPDHYYKVGDKVSEMYHDTPFGVVISRTDRECEVEYLEDRFKRWREEISKELKQ